MLKSITLHRPAVDNADGFQHAGADLVVGDAAKAGVIDATRAKELVAGHGASGHYEAVKTKAPSKPSTSKRKAAAKPAAPSNAEPVKPAPPVETPAPEADLGTSD
jgi:hypothetical protein